MLRRAFFLTEKQVRNIENAARVSGLHNSEVLRRIIDKHFQQE